LCHDDATGKESAAHRPRDCQRAILLAYFHQAVGHFVKRITPRNGSETAAAALAYPAQRCAQPLLLICPLVQRADAFDAERAARTRMLRIRRDLGHLAIFDRE